MNNSFRNYLAALAKSPLTILRILLLIILMIIWVIILFFKALICGKKRPKRPCPGEIPDYAKRRPDPCIYSQTYLMEQGLPVTWNNPDIQITEPDGTPVSSSALQSDHDYRVVGTISNASFDAALGVTVRCVFRNWGVGGPFEPIQKDVGGNEVINFVHIGGYGQQNAVFEWHTPDTSGHYCLKIICSHPDDMNTANNTGQENTNVVAASAGASASATMRLANPANREARMRFRIDTYEIPEREWHMKLESTLIPLGDRPILGGAPKENVGVLGKTGRWALARRRILYRFSRYLGRGELFAQQRKARTPLPDGWRVEIDGVDPEGGLMLGAREVRDVEVRVTIPPSAASGDRVPINIGAWDTTLGPLGGVTLSVDVN